MKVDVMKLLALRRGRSPGTIRQGLCSLSYTEHLTEATRATRAKFQVGMLTPQHSNQRVNLHE